MEFRVGFWYLGQYFNIFYDFYFRINAFLLKEYYYKNINYCTCNCVISHFNHHSFRVDQLNIYQKFFLKVHFWFWLSLSQGANMGYSLLFELPISKQKPVFKWTNVRLNSKYFHSYASSLRFGQFEKNK